MLQKRTYSQMLETAAESNQMKKFEILVKLAKLNDKNEKEGKPIKCEENQKLWEEYQDIN